MIFQSTRPVWGATVGVLVIVPNAQQISIHAPRVGRDSAVGQLRDRQQYFNPRAPCGARHAIGIQAARIEAISIHAPRVGRDYLTMLELGATPQISIHAPRVGRDPGHQVPGVGS